MSSFLFRPSYDRATSHRPSSNARRAGFKPTPPPNRRDEHLKLKPERLAGDGQLWAELGQAARYQVGLYLWVWYCQLTNSEDDTINEFADFCEENVGPLRQLLLSTTAHHPESTRTTVNSGKRKRADPCDTRHLVIDRLQSLNLLITKAQPPASTYRSERTLRNGDDLMYRVLTRSDGEASGSCNKASSNNPVTFAPPVRGVASEPRHRAKPLRATSTTPHSVAEPISPPAAPAAMPSPPSSILPLPRNTVQPSEAAVPTATPTSTVMDTLSPSLPSSTPVPMPSLSEEDVLPPISVGETADIAYASSSADTLAASPSLSSGPKHPSPQPPTPTPAAAVPLSPEPWPTFDRGDAPSSPETSPKVVNPASTTVAALPLQTPAADSAAVVPFSRPPSPPTKNWITPGFAPVQLPSPAHSPVPMAPKSTPSPEPPSHPSARSPSPNVVVCSTVTTFPTAASKPHPCLKPACRPAPQLTPSSPPTTQENAILSAQDPADPPDNATTLQDHVKLDNDDAAVPGDPVDGVQGTLADQTTVIDIQTTDGPTPNDHIANAEDPTGLQGHDMLDTETRVVRHPHRTRIVFQRNYLGMYAKAFVPSKTSADGSEYVAWYLMDPACELDPASTPINGSFTPTFPKALEWRRGMTVKLALNRTVADWIGSPAANGSFGVSHLLECEFSWEALAAHGISLVGSEHGNIAYLPDFDSADGPLIKRFHHVWTARLALAISGVTDQAAQVRLSLRSETVNPPPAMFTQTAHCRILGKALRVNRHPGKNGRTRHVRPGHVPYFLFADPDGQTRWHKETEMDYKDCLDYTFAAINFEGSHVHPFVVGGWCLSFLNHFAPYTEEYVTQFIEMKKPTAKKPRIQRPGERQSMRITVYRTVG